MVYIDLKYRSIIYKKNKKKNIHFQTFLTFFLINSDINSRYWELQENQTESVAGKIQERAVFWEEELKSPPFIVDVVKNGYKLPFVSTPPSFFARNNKSSQENQNFVTESIINLLKK